MNDQLDPQAMALTKAIRQVESGGNFKARSKDGSFGAYQFLKPTWDNTARKYGVNAEWEKATPQQQNEVAYKQIKEWKDKGHNVGEIASMWNAGAGRPQAYLQGVQGTNSSGVNYNVANYAKKVATLYQEYKGQSQPQVQQEPIEPVEPIEPTIQEQKQVIQTQGQPVSVRKDRTQPTLVGGIIRDIVKQPIKAALTIARPFVDPIGKKSGLSVNTKYLGNVGDYGTEIEKSTNNLANKYKAGEISLGRAALGGAGAGALQAMDFAAVAPVGKVASQAIRGTVKQSLVPTLKAAAKESLIRGGAVGAGYDVSSQLASGEKYNPLQTVAAGTIGTVADFGLSYGLPKTVAGTKSFAKNNLTKTGRDAKLTRKVEEELRNVENNYAKLRKNQKFSKDANTETRKRIIASGVLDDATDTTGTINTDNAIKKYRDASGLTGNEGVVRENLERLGEKVNLKSVEKELTDSIYASGLEGAELRTALNNVKKEISGYRLRADANGDVPLTFIHDTKIGTTSGINFMTPPEVKAYKKALASGLRSTVENNSQFNVKEVNQELSPLFKDIEYLESLNGRKVKGGKLGKYASQITGNIVGGAVGGAIGGFPGSAIGTVVGGEVGSALRGSSLSKVLRGPGAKELPVSKVLQKAAATAKSPRLGLPEPKAGLPKSQNFVPIELPGVKEPVYRSPRIAGNTTQYTNIPNTKPKNIDISTQLPKSKVKSSDLSTEAKKYKSAEEFVKAQGTPVYRGGVDLSKEKITNSGISVSSGKNVANDFVKQKGGTVQEHLISPEAKIINYADVPNVKFKNLNDYSPELDTGNRQIWRDLEVEYQKAVDWAKAKGYDGVKLPLEGETRIINPEVLKTKSQLTDIWNKANKKVAVELPTGLEQEAKKYKSADEFVKAQPKLYHGGTAEIKDIQLGKTNFQKTFYMSDNADYAKSYGGNKSSLNDIWLNPKAKLADLRNPDSKIITEIESIISSKPTGKNVRIQKPDGSFIEVPETKGGLQNAVHSTKEIIQGIKDGKAYFTEMPEVKTALKNLGYDGMITQESKFGANYGVWNKDIVKTKSQLTDIWKKANKK